MKQFYKIINLLSLVLILVFSIDSFSQNASISINGNQTQTVCLNQNIFIRFSVNSGNDDPYTFTYTINGALPAQTITTASGSNSVLLPVNNSISGPFIFLLTGVVDNNNNNVDIGSNNQVTITVNSTPAPIISGNLSICDGATSQLTVTGGSTNFNWTLQPNNSNVVTISNNGLVAGDSPGTVRITYQNNNGCDNSVLFTVNPLPTITPSLPNNQSTNSICAGSTLNLNGSGTPATTNPWTSSNTAVATVDSSGLVTGVAAGSVTITYTDINGCTATRNITVNGAAADFTYTPNGPICSGSAVSFNATTPGSSYTWNFGDGGTSSIQNPTHTFTSLGCGSATYNVSLTVTGANGCSKTITKDVTIKQQPVVGFKDNNVAYNPSNLLNQFNNCLLAGANPNYNVSVGQLTTNSTCISSYSVLWGDGSPNQTFTSFPLTHSYTSLGAFNMVITAVGTNGCSITKTYLIKNESNPSGGLVSPGSTTNLCAPTSSIEFELSNWGRNSPGTTYTINYGDGSPPIILLQSNLIQTSFYNSTTPNASLNYPVPHTYTLTTCPNAGITAQLIISNSCGTTNSTISPIVILKPPTPNFTNPPIACVGSCVLLTNTSIPAYGVDCAVETTYEWDFGDGTPVVSSSINTTGAPNPPCHTYSTAGTYTITLTAYGYCGVFSKTNTICIEPPLSPQFTLSGTEFCTPGNVTTTNTTNLANSCSVTYLWNVTYADGYCGTAPPTWSYTNGTSGTSANPSFNFVTPGTYSITLTTTNSCGTVTTLIQTVIIKKPPTVAINSIPDICLGATVTPTVLVNSCSNLAPSAYSWTAAGATPSTSNAATPPTFSYATPGNYTISHSVTNECGTTNASQSFVVNPIPIITGPSSVCAGQTITLTANSAGSATNPWVSSNPSAATVSATGVVTGIAAGNASITFTNSSNCQTTKIITVNPLPTITGNLSVCLGLTTQLTGSATPATNNPWVSSNNSVASISNTGLVTSVSVGTTTITYTNSNNCQITATVTVNPLPSVTGPTSVCVGSTISLVGSATAASSNAWISSIPSVATVSTTGVVTGVSVGTSIITYTNSNNCQNTLTVTVNPKPIIPAQTAIACSGSSFSVTPVNNPPLVIVPSGTTYSWPAPTAIGLTGLVAGNNQTSISGTLINTTNAPINVTYTVTATSGISPNTCSNTFNLVVTVNPKPLIPNQTVSTCSGTAFTVPLTNAPPSLILPSATTYTWTVTNPSGISGASNQTTGVTSISQTLTNLTNAAIDVLYDVTASSGISPNNCTNTFTVTVTVNPTPKISNVTATICSNTPFSVTPTNGGGVNSNDIVPTGTTYSWPAPVSSPVGAVTGGSLGTNVSAPISQNLINSTSSPATLTYTVTPKSGNCTGTPFTIVVTVNPSPSVTFSPVPQTICSGDSSVLVTLSSPSTGVTFSWTATQPTGITGVTTIGTNTIPVQLLTNSTNAPISITYIATGAIAGPSVCSGTTYNYTITVKPRPSITENFTSTICSGGNFSITPTNSSLNSIPTGTTYSWSAPMITGGITGGAASSNQTSITGALNNPTDIVQTATYTVTPSTSNCQGASFTVVVTVNPKPIIPAQTAIACSGSSFSVTPVNNPPLVIVPSGTTYSWPAPTAIGLTGLVAGNNQTSISGTLINTTNAPINVTYTVTATSGISPNTCSNTFNLVVTVNPKPLIPNQTVSTCSGTAFTVPLTNAPPSLILPSATTYTWTVTNPSGISGASNQTTGVTSISQTLTNLTNAAIDVLYDVTASSGISPNNCTNTFTVTVTVNPTPKISNVTATICSNTPFSVTPTNGGGVNSNDIVPTGTTYSWPAPVSSPVGAVTGGSLGTNVSAPISQNLINSTSSPATLTYTVTPKSGNCTGTPFTIVVTVNPSPSVTFSPVPQTICSGDSSVLVTLSSPSTGVTFSWTATQPTGITGVTTIGTNTIPVQLLTNSTNAPISITYIATGAIAGPSVCSGTTYNYTITVKPRPSITENFTSTICSGGNFSITPTNSSLNSIPTGTTYSWSAPMITGGITGGAASSNQTSITGALNNPTDIVQTATYTVTPSTSNCQGASFTVVVTVNPKPIIPAQTAIACSGSSFSVTPVNNPPLVIVPSGTTYSWPAPTAIGLTGLVAGNNQTSISGTLINTTNAPINVTYTVTATSGISPNTCSNTFNLVVTVNPKPLIPNQTVSTCSGTAFTVPLTNAPPSLILPSATTYTWTVTNPSGISGASNQTTGVTSISQTLTNLTNAAIDVLYDVTASSGISPNNCTNTFTVTVTVNPTPKISNVTATICSNTPFSVTPTNGGGVNSNDIVPTGTTYSWPAPVSSPVGAVTGGSLGTNVSAPIGQNLINSTSSPATLTYTVTPKSGNCTGTPFTIVVTVNPSPSVTFSPVPQTICSGDSSVLVTLSSPSTGVTFSWTATQPTGITGVTTIGTNTIPVQLLTNSTNAPISITYIATGAIAGPSVCSGTTYNYTITVKPRPSITENFTSTICSGGNFSITPTNSSLNSIPTGTTYSWSAPMITGGITGGAASSNQTSITGALNNPTDIVQTATYTVTPSTSNCQGASFTVVVTVNPKPIIPAQTAIACSGSSFSVTPVNNPPLVIVPSGTTYSWPAPTAIGLTGLVAGNNQTSISGTLINTTNAPINVTYTVTATSGISPNTCSNTFNLVVTVNPKPLIPNQTVSTCSGTAFTVPLTNAPPSLILPSATTYTWTVTNPSGISGASNQTTGVTSISQTLTNLTNAAIDVLYDVTASSGISPNNCTNTFTVTVTVNPTPKISNVTATICSNTPFSVTPTNGGGVNSNDIVPTGTTYSWPAPVSSPVGAVTGGSLGTNVSAPIGQNLINSTSSPATLTYTVTPKSGNCTGTPFTIVVTVQSNIGNSSFNISKCSGVPIGISLGSDPTITFQITSITSIGLTPSAGNPITGIGLPANEIADDVWLNSTPSPLSVTYTIVPSGNNGCSGQPFTVTATINPEPVVVDQTATICSDSASGVSLNLSSSVAASTYNITAINQNGLTASAGVPVIGTNLAVNVIADDAWTNITPLPVDVVYTVVPVSANNCQGNPFTVTLTINPEPVVANQTGTICSDVVNGVILGNDVDTPQAATYNITNINSNLLPPFAGNPTTGTGLAANVIADDAWTNTTPAAVNVIYTVVPVSADGCKGNPFTVTITVESTLGVGPKTITACSDAPIGFILGTAPNTTYNITAINQNGLTPSAGNPVIGNGFSANEIADDAWTNTTPVAVTVVFTVLPVSSNGCIGQPFTVTATINPEPVVVDQTATICSDSASGVSLNLSSSVSSFNL
jgi:large repetitive protein